MECRIHAHYYIIPSPAKHLRTMLNHQHVVDGDRDVMPTARALAWVEMGLSPREQ